MPVTSTDSRRTWLLLLFFLPAAQAQARVQAWRRLQRLGAVLLKNSAYALPYSAESREDFEWIKSGIVGSGGQAMVLVTRAPDAATDDEIAEAFRAARGRDFSALAGAAAKLLAAAARTRSRGGARGLTQKLRRLRERFDETAARDFCGAPGRDRVAALLSQLDQHTGRTRMTESPRTTPADAARYRGQVWQTRPRPGVDRMSSAWLIRRFIDPAARFVFTSSAPAAAAAIPFDTFEAEFGHHGTHCTFETLCERFAIVDPSVRHIARIVHDLDLKDPIYGEPETATIGRLVEGLRRAHADDEELLRDGISVFEALYQSLAAQAAPPAARAKTPPRRRARTPRIRRRSKQS